MDGISHLTEREYVIAGLEVAAANQLTTRVKASGHYLNRAPRLIKKQSRSKAEAQAQAKVKAHKKYDPEQDRRLFIPRSDTQQQEPSQAN